MRIAGIALVSVFIAGCGASLPPPTDEWAAAQADIGRAEAGGAPGVPDAKLHLQLAQEDLQKSKDMMDNKDNKRATSVIAVARAEAQLALSLAHAAVAQDQATQAQAQVQKAKGGGQ